MFLLSLSVLFNLWFYFKTPSKIDNVLVKNHAFFHRRRFSFSQNLQLAFVSIPIQKKQSKSFIKSDQQLQDSYLIFTIVIAVMSIGIECILAKSTRIIQHNNQSLRFDNGLMVKQNNDLRNNLAVLEESTAENSKMLQVIVHDLRSPVAAIVGLAGFMMDEHQLADEDMEVINLIHTSGIDSLKFINEILDCESAALEMKKETVDLQSLLAYCISQFKYKALEKHQNIVLECPTSLKLRLNREKIWRVINNLISNALKFSPEKSTIIIALQVTKVKAIISVKDHGIGIPENLKDKIFGSNDLRKRAGTAGEKSFGIGLPLAKQIVEEHDGTLSFTSGNEKGTTFFVELPIP